ncbi:hypothetical protein [Deinococcus wulumuqiensis]|uniref:Uncharacterized protein n=2 Tax=Deinococcus wulumuqiensis TaxID=980427 RepID=A0AAV4K6L0_9DEIO|nr:hypothetical protein [Deinococcus wulumuqiensis]QII19319.1 hypothetical protein G6R31_13485 [Deinococcus wulumuqiensis R12]GGI90240.1 hypothetical protein GCM10010914_25820 [Deinococcus wulumuqiensis]GGP30743.1 hypothetical protein GCM10008021_23940 [Deinococcus wulumuqiensis]
MRHLLLTAALLTLAPAAFAGGAGPRPAPRPAPAPVAPAPKPAPKPVPAPQPAPAPVPAVTSPAAPALLADAVFQPGQTWVLSGTTAGGESIERELVLDDAAPEWDDGWSFESDLGPLSYDPETGLVFAADVMTGMEEDSDLQVCMGFVQDKSVTGVLVSGDMDSISEQLSMLDGEGDAPETAEGLAQAFEDAGVEVGTCTLNLK